ncbi:HAD family hydrolase [candidate division WOR-3 bacterium]|nr:HAD family hydrolase [candidate division WOR-3 bacterium]
MTKSKRLLIFDLDGTIIDVFGCGRRAIDKTMHQMFGIKGTGSKLNFSSSTDYVIFLDLIERFDLKGRFFERIDEFYSIYAEKLKEEIAENANSRFQPGFPELLEFLKTDKKIYLAIATGNMKVGAMTKMAYFEIQDYFPVGGFGDKALNKKEVIYSGCKKAKDFYNYNFEKEDVFVIGDSSKDISAARDLGFHSIAVTTGLEDKDTLKSKNPDWLFDDLSFSTLPPFF